MNTYMKMGLVTVCCDYGYVNQVMSYSTYYSAFTLWTGRAKERNCYSYKVLWIKLNHMNDLKCLIYSLYLSLLWYLLLIKIHIVSRSQEPHIFSINTNLYVMKYQLAVSYQVTLTAQVLLTNMKQRTGYNKILFQDKRYCTNGSWWNIQN